jgi:hypothetical protein
MASLRAGSPDTPVLLLIGVERAAVPIPDTACTLYLTPLVANPVRTNLLGRVDIQTPVPASVAPGTLLFQFLSLAGDGKIAATQGMSLAVF